MLTVTTGGPGSIRDTRLRMDLRPAVPGQLRSFARGVRLPPSGRSRQGLEPLLAERAESESLALPPSDELFESDVAVSLGIGHFEIE